MVDPIAAFALATAKDVVPGKILEWLRGWSNRTDEKFVLARDEMFRDWLVELVQAIEELRARGRRFQEFTEREEYARDSLLVLTNYAEQAWREPHDERRTMLAHMAAGIIDARVTAAEHARVQRRIHELEPTDIVALDAVARCCSRVIHTSAQQSDEQAQWTTADAFHASESLNAAGCFRADRGTWGSATGFTLVSDFGRLVLKTARSYVLLRRDPFCSPGHEAPSGSRSEADARTMLEATEGLQEYVRTASRSTPTRFLTKGWHHANGQLNAQAADGQAWLSLESVDGQVIAALTSAVGAATDLDLGKPTNVIGAHVVKV